MLRLLKILCMATLLVISPGMGAAQHRTSKRAMSSPQTNDQAVVTQASALVAQGNSKGAESLLRGALTKAPQSATLNDALGTVLAQSGRMAEALPFFERATALNPALAIAQYHLGTARLGLEDVAHAVEPLTLAAAALPASFDVQLQLGRAFSAQRRDAEALDHLHRAAALRTAQVPPDATYALALALEGSGDAAGSLPLFAATTQSPDSLKTATASAALTNYALARVQTGDAAGALPLYAHALALGPDAATLREDYGVAFLQQQDLDQALDQFHAGLLLDPASAHLHYDLALALKLKDNLAEAIPEFERAAELDPSLPDPAYTLGVIYMQQGRNADAAAQLHRATELQPTNGDAWAVLGSVLKDSGDAPGAVAALQRALALEPDQPSLHIQLAALYVQAGRRQEAASERKLAAEMSQLAGNRQRAQFALRTGRTLLAQARVTEAMMHLHTAAEADPTLAEPHTLLAEGYQRQGNTAEAAMERRKANDLAPRPAAQ